ncbi:TadE/TadG family type IV pilus assembly protein [Streptomyces albipurpureus]|uniref:Pilus assembly protein n=1 Tax=Streptomyces albipurpureus TaxID=2897419 RepID=A0ABT0UM43_9ACTN|nr:TadE/TadG family type IV pilus assembly protein [Streptomyces sp. CWNU-1]MCM2389180.1 pilus assembly protein [Streptomyces sp. CWNU-1]
MSSPSRRTDRGQAAIEYAGMISLLLFVALAAIQLGVVAYTAQQAGTAARAGARAASMPEGDISAAQAANAAVSDWLTPKVEPGTCAEEVTVTVRIEIPRVLPVFDFDPAWRSVTMPCD